MMPTRTALLAVAGVLSACAIHRTAPPPEAARKYSLTVRLSPAEGAMDVSGAFDVSPASEARNDLTVLLAEPFSRLEVTVDEPAARGGTAKVERIGAAARAGGERGGSRWRITPARPIPAGARVTLRFAAQGRGGPALIYYVGPDVAFASTWGDPWYPRLEGEDGEGIGELTVHVPEGWSVVMGAGATGTSDDEGRGIFRFTQTHASGFTFVAGPFTRVKREGVVPLTAWLLKPRSHIDHWLAGVDQMLGVLSAEFGPYRFGGLSLVEVPRAVAEQAGFNAFSPIGMVVLNHRAFDATDVKYEYEWLGHELTHQWLPHALIWDPPGFLYLEEAFAEYGGLRIVDSLAGRDALRQLRMTGFEYDPIYSASAYFRLVAGGVDEPLGGMKAGLDQRNLAYNKGALVFDMLSREVGVHRFREMMRELTGRGPSTISWTQFTEAVNRAAGRDMGWFWDQWLNRTGAPEFQLAWTQDAGSVRATITQTEPVYRTRLVVEARGKGGERTRQVVEMTGARLEMEFAAGFDVDSLVLDPDYEVLRWTPQFRAMVDSARTRTP